MNNAQPPFRASMLLTIFKKPLGHDTNDGRTLDVLPRLPPIKTEGEYRYRWDCTHSPLGLSVDGEYCTQSSCASEQAPTTEMIFNYASAQEVNRRVTC